MSRSLDELTSVDRADVYKGRRLAGALSRTAAGVQFTYTSDYLEVGGPPVATTLPLSADVISTGRPGAIPPFFAGLLPEGRRLSGLRQAVKTSLDDELSLLLAVGADTVGDVRIVPADEEPVEASPLVVVERDWAEVRFRDLLADASIVDPVGIPGVQDKASARMISVPVRRAGERHLLKIDPPEYAHVVENEHFFVGIARSAGLTTAHVELVHDADGRPGLLVRRFDRLAQPDGSVDALGCEDACQVLAVWPEAKYRLSAEQIATGLADRCAARPVALLAVFRQFVTAWLIGNGDTHGKNFSILASADGEWAVSPAYDIVSTAVYGDLSFAVALQGRTTGFSRRQFLDFAGAIGLRQPAAERALDDILGRTHDLIDAVAAHEWSYPQSDVRRWVGQLRFRRRQLIGP